MYVPPLFRMAEAEAIAAFCDAHPFATLVTTGEGGLFATPLPVVRAGPPEALAFHGHVARANPHPARAAPDAEALLIFAGPDAYVTPSWYATKRETAKVVPTWNYAAVHCRGRLEWPEDMAFLEENLRALTARHEAGREHPWAVDDAPADFRAMQMRAIVGMRFVVTGLDAKAKMSQNRPTADVDGVIAGFTQEGEPRMAAEVARLRPTAKP